MIEVPSYQILGVIGYGSFGFVFKALDHKRNRIVALKRIEKVGMQLSREYEILQEIKDCKQIVKMLDFYYSRSEKENKLIQNIVFEYMEDNLENMIQKYNQSNQQFSTYQIQVLFDKLISQKYIQRFLDIKYYKDQLIAMKEIQLIGIQNRIQIIIIFDIKRENILINDETLVKLCDFGSSKKLDDNGKNTPYIVSRYYRAPELILCITSYTTAIDIWALEKAVGCILAELSIGEPLFQGKNEGDQLFSILKILGSFEQYQLDQYSQMVPFDPNIFEQFLPYQKQNWENKLQIEEKDKQNFIHLLTQMFQYLPSERISAKMALRHPFFDEIHQLFNQ